MFIRDAISNGRGIFRIKHHYGGESHRFTAQGINSTPGIAVSSTLHRLYVDIVAVFGYRNRVQCHYCLQNFQWVIAPDALLHSIVFKLIIYEAYLYVRISFAEICQCLGQSASDIVVFRFEGNGIERDVEECYQ